MNKIFDTLRSLGLTSLKTRELFSSHTRDNKSLKVWKDKVSGVIYIEDFVTPFEDFKSGEYRNGSNKGTYESERDLNRRLQDHEELYLDSVVCDFGCGSGDFIRKAALKASKVAAVELQENHFKSLNLQGISCKKSILEHDILFDTVFAFHSLEHLGDPLKYLEEIKSKIKSKGKILIEVPHANDFLLSLGFLEEFKDFTLWSSHLVLYTEEALQKILEKAGFKDILIHGIQRYPLSNHLYWLHKKKPGGHKKEFSLIDSKSLHYEYEKVLSKINQTDTLIASATVR